MDCRAKPTCNKFDKFSIIILFPHIYFTTGPFEWMEGSTFSVHKELIRHLLLAKISLVFG